VWLTLLLLTSSLAAQEIQWRKDYGQARQEAIEKGRPLLLTFTSQNCRWCYTLDSTTYRDPVVNQYVAEKFVPLKVEAEMYPGLVSGLGIQGFPTIVVASASGRILEVHRGYIEAAPFAEFLSRSLTKLPSSAAGVGGAVASKQQPAKAAPTTKEQPGATAKDTPKDPATTTSTTKEQEPTTTAAAPKETISPRPTPPEKKVDTPAPEKKPEVAVKPPPAAEKKAEVPVKPTPGPEKQPEVAVKPSPAPEKNSEVAPPQTKNEVAQDLTPPPAILIPPAAPAPKETPDPVVKRATEPPLSEPQSPASPPAAPKSAAEPGWMADDFRRAAEAVSRSEFPRAVRLLKNLLRDDIQWPSQARAMGLMREIERQASTRLARVKEAEGRGEVTEAIRLAQEIVSRYDGTEAASEALGLVSTLSARLEDKDRDRMLQAQAILRQANEDYNAGQWLPCLLRCEDLQARYSDQPESVKAGELMAKIKSNPASLQRVCDGLPEVAGQVYLTMAEVKIKQGEPQQAMFYLDCVLQAFPNSKHAEMAQVRLSQIQGPPTVNSPTDERKD
jgi:thioredoxin-related protein